jgi:hypothetical protein
MVALKNKVGAILTSFALAATAVTGARAQETVALTPQVLQQVKDGAKICKKSDADMIKARDGASQFVSYTYVEGKKDDTIFSEIVNGTRTNVLVTKVNDASGYEKRAMANVLPTDKPENDPKCPTKFWNSRAILDANSAYKAAGF